MKDPEIKRVVGVEKFDTLSIEEKRKACIQFNEDMIEFQEKLLGGPAGIPKGVYRFKNQEDADKQVEFYMVKKAIWRQKQRDKQK